jgi:hypothetical protein
MGSNRVTLPVATASFIDVFEATGFEGQDAKFQATAIFKEGQDLSTLEAAINAAIDKKWPEGAPKKNFSLPLKDGNLKTDKEGDVRPEYKGRVYITAKSKASDPPGVVDEAVQPIIDPKAIYGGCEVRLAVSAYGWTFGGKSGVSLYLNNVQKVGDGEAFGATASAEDDFS